MDADNGRVRPPQHLALATGPVIALAGMSARLDPRSQAAKSKLEDALLALCADRPLSSISVAELASRAGVARKTFYQHYESIESLARAIVEQAFVPAIESIPDNALKKPLSMNAVRHVLLCFVADRARMAVVAKAFGSDLVVDVMKPSSDAAARRMLALQGIDDEFRVAYLSSGATGILLSILRTWIDRGFIDGPEELIELVSPVLKSALRKFLELARTRPR